MHSITQVRPGIFQIATPDFVASVDAEAYEPQVIVRYAAGINADCVTPVYSRDHDFRGTGITITVVNANPNFVALPGEKAIVDAMLDAAHEYQASQPCSCRQRAGA